MVGGKLSLGGLYEKLGITTQTFSQGANAGIFSSSEPFSNSQKVMMRNMMVQTYRQFQDRVLSTRKGRIANLEDVCQGRIFVGRRAVELGLVDEIGGIEKAISYAAGKGGLGKDYAVRVLPAPRTLADILSGDAQEHGPGRLSCTSGGSISTCAAASRGSADRNAANKGGSRIGETPCPADPTGHHPRPVVPRPARSERQQQDGHHRHQCQRWPLLFFVCFLCGQTRPLLGVPISILQNAPGRVNRSQA